MLRKKPEPLTLIVALTDFKNARSAVVRFDRKGWPSSLWRALEEAGIELEEKISMDPVEELLRDHREGKLDQGND